MKRLYKLTILFSLLISLSLTSAAQTLETLDVPSALCKREFFTLAYDFQGGAAAGNTYIAELSDAAGNFIAPIQIGSFPSVESTGTIYCQIPDGLPVGTGYVIRVLATSTLFGQVPIPSGPIDISCTTRDYYWLGGSGNWSDLSKWEWTVDDITYTPATELPTANDNVIIDDTTFPTGGQLTIDVTAYCNDFYWDPLSAANNPTFYGESGGNSLNVKGDFILSPGVNRELWDLFFNSQKHHIYIDFGDNRVDNVPSAWWQGYVDFRSGGSWDLGSNLIAENIGIYDNSTFNTIGYRVDLKRELYVGNGTVNLSSSEVYTTGVGLYSNFNADFSTVYFQTNSNGWTPYINGNGSQVFNDVIISDKLANINSDNSFENLSVINGGGMNIQSNTHQTINQSFTAQGLNRGSLAILKSNNVGIQHTFNIAGGASVIADYVDITDSEIINMSSPGSPYSATNGVDGGNNLHWNISTLAPLEYYWTGGPGNWSDVGNWSTSVDGGTTMTPAIEIPGSPDNVNFNASSFPSGGRLTVDQNVYINTMNWEAGSGDAGPEIWSDYDYDFTVYGDVTFDNGVIRSIRRLFLDSSKGNISLTGADNLGDHGNLFFQGGGIIEIKSDFENRGWTYFQDATVNSNDYDLSLYAFDISSNSAVVNFGNSNLYLDYYWYVNPSATVDFGTSTAIANRPDNFPCEIYGTANFNNFIVRTFAMFYDDNSFTNLTVEPGGILHIQDSRTLTVSGTLNLTGTRSEFATIDVFNGTNGTINASGASTSADFVDISNNTIIPATSATSGIDGGNNTGWTIGPLPALDFYWVGGAGNWSDPAHWATTDGGSTLHGFPPGPVDNAIFTSNSFPSGGVVTIDQPVTVANMTWQAGSGTTNPEIFGDWGIRFAVTNSITMDDGVRRRIRQLAFDSSTGNVDIDMADNFDAQGNLTFEGGGTWTLLSDLSQGNDFNFYEGTLNTNNNNLSIGSFNINGNTVLNLGTSTINIDYALRNNSGSFTLNDANAVFAFENQNNGRIRGPFTLTNVYTNSIIQFEDTNDNTIVNLTVDPGSTIRIFAGTTQTVTGSLNMEGTRSSLINIDSWDYGTPGIGTLDITGATVNMNFLNVTDNTVLPSATIASGLDGGNNLNWTIGPMPALDFYWINGSGNWTNVSHWQTSDDGGATFVAATGAPGPVDNVFFTTNSFPAGGTITIDQPVTINDMTWEVGSGLTNPEMFGSWENGLTIRGDLTMDNGVRRRAYTMIFDSSNGENNLTLADSYDSYGDMRFIGDGNWNILDSLYCGAGLQIDDGGTFNTNDNPVKVRFTFSINSDQSTLNFGSSSVYLRRFYNYTASATLNMGTSVFYFGDESNSVTRIRSNQTQTNFNHVVASDPLEIQDNNSFDILTILPGSSLTLQSGTNQTVVSELNIVGSRSQIIDINSDNPGLPATLSVAGATITAEYIAVQDNVIDNGLTADVAANNAIDNGNITGWDLTPLTGLDMYWIDGTGDWTDPTHWSYTNGGTANVDGFAPGPLDNAFFTSNSFTSVGRITVDQSVTVNNVTWEAGSGVNNPEFFGDYNNPLIVLGNLTMDDGVQRRVYELRIDSRNNTNQVYLADNNNAAGNIRFQGDGIANLASDLHTNDYIVIDGATLNTNDFNTESYGLNFEGNNSTLNLGASNVQVYGYLGVYANNPVLNAGTSTIIIEHPDNNNDDWFTRLENYSTAIDFNNFLVNRNLEIYGDNNFQSLVVNEGATLSLYAGSTQTIANGGNLSLQGSRAGLVDIESWTWDTPGRGIFSAVGASVTADFVRIKDNIIDNGLAANVLATNAVDLGNNIGWDYSAIVALDFYWINGAGNWSDITHWQTSPDGGSTFEAAIGPPGAVDNVFFTAASFPDGGALTFDVTPEVNDMTWGPGSGANFPVLLGDWPNNELIIHGSLQMADGVTRNFYRLNFDSDNTGNTISLADNLYGGGDIDFNGTGEWTLLDSLSTDYLNIRGGTLNTGDQPVYAWDQIYLDWQNNGTVNWGASNVYLMRLFNDSQNLTFNAGTSTFNFRALGGGNNTLVGHPLALHDVTIDSRMNIENSYSFNNVTLAAGTDLILQSGTTQTIATSFGGVGNRGQMISISSSNAGNTATIFINSLGPATVNLEYAIIQDNILDNGDGDPGTQEIAASSVDNGNNQGWDFLTSPLAPLDYYWVGGTGNWSDITHWVTEDNGTTTHLAPPGVIDNVFFTSNSFPESGTITLDQPAACNDMTWSDGSFSPTITGNFENRLTIRGNLSIANGVNRHLEYLEFNSDTDNLLILGDNRFGGYSEFIFRGSGSWSLIDSLSATNIQIYSGTFNTLDNPVNLNWDFNIHGEGAIGLNLGSSTLRASNINNWSSPGFVTANMGTSTISILDDGRIGGNEIEFYNLTIEGHAWVYPIVTATNDLTILPGGTLELSPDNTITVGNLVAAGTRPLPVTIQSWDQGRQATLSSAGTITASDIVIRDNNAVGGAIFNAIEAIDRGNNDGWNFSPITPIDFYWTGGSGDWSDITHWQISTDGGSTFSAASFAPGAVDNVNVDAILTSSCTINLDYPAECNNMLWSSGLAGSSISGDFDSPFTIHGSLTLTAGVSTDLEQLIFDSETSGNTIDMADNEGNQFINTIFRGSGDWQLVDSLSTYDLYLESGTLATNGQPINVEYLSLYSDGTGSLNLGNSTAYVRTFDGSPQSTNFIPGTSTIHFDEDAIVYNSWTFNNVVAEGELFFRENNTINELTLMPGSTLIIDAGDTLSLTKLTANGLRSRPISIRTDQAGTQSTIQQQSGSVNATYLTLQDNNAIGGAFFIAQNSIDNGNNDGWTIIQTTARDYYWVGGTGKWSEFNSHWSNTDGGSQFYDSSPGPLDNVFFTTNSFPSGGTLTLDFPISVNDMDWTGNTSQVSITDNGDPENTLTVGGDFILANGVSRDFTNLYLVSNNSGNVINTADNLSGLNYVRLQGTGEWNLAGNFESYYLFLEGGTFNSNDHSVDATLIYLLDDNISNWGTSNVITRRFYTQGLNNSSTFNSDNSTFLFNEQTVVRGNNRFFNVQVNADAIFQNSNIIINAEVHDGTLEVYEGQAFSNLFITDGATVSIAPGIILTVNLGLNITGSVDEPITINSTEEGATGFFTVPASGSVNATFVHLKDNTANSGGATFNTTNSSDFGNVSGWLGLLAGQSIDFAPLNDQTFASGGFSVGASSSSGLNVGFEIASGNATISGSTITPGSSGLIGVRAIQSGDGSFGSAKPITQYIHIDATDDPEELGGMKEARITIGQSNPYVNGRFYNETTVPEAWASAVSSTGKLAIANGTRVMIWNQIPTGFDVPADVVVGHDDFTTDFAPTATASSFKDQVYSVSFTRDDKMIVSDQRGVLIFNTIPTTNGAEADVIIGQTNFTATRSGTAADRFDESVIYASVYYDEGTSNESLIVSDFGNSRVLLYNTIPTSNGASADVVVGQADFNSKASGAAANKLDNPLSAFAHDGKLYVADYGNNRVVVFNSIPATNGANADYVLGQPGFGFNESGASATLFNGPTSIDISRMGKMAIADYLNNRVLIYNSIPGSSTTTPDIILGQPHSESSDANFNDISGRTMDNPIGVSWDVSNNLFVADVSNNRVLLYGAADLDGPVIEVNNTPQVHNLNGGTAGNLTLSDRSPINVILRYRGISDPSGTFEELNLTELAGNVNFNTTDIFPAGEELGIEYEIEITDYYGNGNPATSDFINIQRDNGLPITNFGVGNATEDYRLFSIPLNLSGKDAKDVFSEITGGTYTKSEFRIFSYPGGASADYVEYGDGLTNLEIGKGYFALSKNAASVNSGGGATPLVHTGSPFEIVLVPGWNLIGNPYNFDVSWTEVLTESAISGTQPQTPVTYTGNSSWPNQSILSPGVGYFVNNPNTGNVTIKIPVENSVGGRTEGLVANTNPLSEDNWEVRFLERNGKGEEMILGAIGMDEYSEESFDEMDRINPPAIGEQPMIEFSHPEFFMPSFKNDYRESSYDQQWEFTYSAPVIDTERTMFWDNSYYGSESPDIYLVDRTNFKVVNMKEESSYSFRNPGKTEFEVFYGFDAMAQIYPDELVTITPYPNPFTDEVRINIGLPNLDADAKVSLVIFNNLGMQVAYLDTYTNNQAYMEFVWKGNNDSGDEVPDGMYAFRVLIDGNLEQTTSGKIIKE